MRRLMGDRRAGRLLEGMWASRSGRSLRLCCSEWHSLDKTDKFIHYGNLYSPFARLLFRSAPDPCAAKKNSFHARVECVGKKVKYSRGAIANESPFHTVELYCCRIF